MIRTVDNVVDTPAGDDVCPSCANKVPFHSRDCPYCMRSLGFPNVRAAASTRETAALKTRYEAAKAASSSSACLDSFEAAVSEESVVVMNRSFADLLKLLQPDSIYTSFHSQVAIGARIAEDNDWDKVRGSVGSYLFPEYFKEINYGALSLDGRGDTYYGGYSLVIDSDAIRMRTSFFHCDSVQFLKNNNVEFGAEVPVGFRSTWQDRGKLAVAKLHSELGVERSDVNFPRILLRPANDGKAGDYIEAHIYGGIIGSAIQRIRSNTSFGPGEKPALKAAIKKAEQRNVFIELGD